MNEPIFITGATGLLGAHLLLALRRNGHQVAALKRPGSDLEPVRRVFGYAGAGDLLSEVRWVDGDLTDRIGLGDCLKGVRQIYHCAGLVSFRRSDRQAMDRFNREGTANLVDASLEARVDKFLHVSSSSAIGSAPEGEEADERLIWSRKKDSTAYAASKFASEMEVWRGMEEGLPAVIVNPTIILGPGFWDKGSSAIVHRVARALRYATPGVTGFVGVWDVARAMIRLMESDIQGERFLLNAENRSYRDVFEQVALALGRKQGFRPVSPGVLQLLARLDGLAETVTRTRRITREQAGAAFSVSRYSNRKITTCIDLTFEPLEDVIRETVRCYRMDFPLVPGTYA
ncbi:MAG: NAD-dependent epimerase/dehydratase family protein [Bacteroidales bacterium]